MPRITRIITNKFVLIRVIRGFDSILTPRALCASLSDLRGKNTFICKTEK